MSEHDDGLAPAAPPQPRSVQPPAVIRVARPRPEPGDIMTVQHHSIAAGEYVRLECADGSTEERWPGPHGPRTVIHTVDRGDYVWGCTDDEDGTPVHVYVCQHSH